MPQTLRQWEDSLRQPALCELLPVRDYLDGCIIRTNGCFVAGYEASGLNTFFHADDTRNRTKEALEALVGSLPQGGEWGGGGDERGGGEWGGPGGVGKVVARAVDADAGSI